MMFIYVVLQALVGVILAVRLITHTKKAEGVVYGTLDKAGRITNVILCVLYSLASPLHMILGAVCGPDEPGILFIIGWLLSIIVGSVVLIWTLGLGYSVALRRQGKSRLSFAVQFAGVGGFLLSTALFLLFYGGILGSLN